MATFTATIVLDTKGDKITNKEGEVLVRMSGKYLDKL
jgi:uncharacterized protein (DUF2345 family)